ncbi:hypothetical protein C7I84_00240 [Mesorhizobium ephedrae]|uniref:Lytic murein transglycosylase n=1 Tax=Kumtagia ephedrae TaxID=2116701 RepID=A0A2P7STR9_9HYPH|nr:hypothetical protein C7I84_00240 [Mesorhizobium ephedrae]
MTNANPRTGPDTGKDAPLRTPLCPAGHLPRKGGDWQLLPCRSFSDAGDWRNQSGRPISPLAGETDGGAKEHQPISGNRNDIPIL